MTQWRCSSEHCNRELPANLKGSESCPFCGQLGRVMGVEISETVDVFSSIRSVKEDPRLPKRKRMRVDLFQGWDVRRSFGDMVRKVRRIDRDARTYFEHVEDREGNVIRHVEESLDRHRGRGSAKLKNDS